MVARFEPGTFSLVRTLLTAKPLPLPEPVESILKNRAWIETDLVAKLS